MSRFSEPQDPTFQALNNSIAFDWRLAPYDIEQSLAHVRMLGRQGIIEGEDVTTLEKGLEAVRAEVEGLELPCPDADGDRRSWFVYVVQLPPEVDRDDTIDQMRAAGIDSKPYLPAIHLMSFYRERFGHREGEFPVCEDVSRRSLALPFYPELTEAQVERVIEALVGIIHVSARGPRSSGSSAATHG